MNTQYKKGVLELCVFAQLSKDDKYGYELVSQISQAIEISEGTIYPLLRRLKQEGYVTTYLQESSGGASRKYYSLTTQGKKHYTKMSKEWKSFVKSVSQLLGEKNE